MNMWLLWAVPVAGFGVLTAIGTARARKVKMQRRELTIDDFFKEFEGAPYSREAIKIAYGDVTKNVGHAVRRFDLLYPTLSVDSEDVEDMIYEHARGRGVEIALISSFLQQFPVKTVDDYVRFVDWILTHPNTVGETH